MMHCFSDNQYHKDFVLLCKKEAGVGEQVLGIYFE